MDSSDRRQDHPRRFRRRPRQAHAQIAAHRPGRALPAKARAMKLTLRDLFWLLLLVAGLTAWGLQHQRNAERYRRETMRFLWFSKERNPPKTQDSLARHATKASLEKLANAQLDAYFAAISNTGGGRHP